MVEGRFTAQTIVNPALEFASLVLTRVRHCQHIGLRAVEATPRHVLLELPYDVRLIGDPTSGIIHGGALTVLMDTACGLAAQLSLEHIEVCPTLDLRIDYMTAAQPQQSVFGHAEVYRVTDNVIFARGTAWQGGEQRTIAHCVATFMRLPAAAREGNTAQERGA